MHRGAAFALSNYPGNVALFVDENVLQAEILVMYRECLRGWLVEGRLREDNPEDCVSTEELVGYIAIV
jgi:hypothetical protein